MDLATRRTERPLAARMRARQEAFRPGTKTWLTGVVHFDVVGA